MKQPEFSYNLNITRKVTKNTTTEIDSSTEISERNTFHIYLIKTNNIPHFDLLNNPAICCSIEGGVICDEEFERKHQNMTDSKHKLLTTYSLYYKDLELFQNQREKTEIALYDKQIINEEGIVYTFFLLCSNRINTTSYDEISSESFLSYTERTAFKLNGILSYSNPDGYLSADELLNIDINLFFSLFYFILSLYWIYKIIVNYNIIKLFEKILTISIPIVILEKMMNLQIYSDLNRYGEINNAFEIICVSCNIFKNVSYRVIFFGLSLGYTIIKK